MTQEEVRSETNESDSVAAERFRVTSIVSFDEDRALQDPGMF